MDFFLVIGTIGMCLILTGFLLINTHKVTADALWYDILNFAGSLLLVISAFEAQIWPFVVLNAVFTVYSLRNILFQDLRTPHKVLRRS